jgi:predicted MFS family arabinose efflux permease
VSVDYAGATLIVGGVSILLVWVSLAGTDFDWVSLTSGLLVAAGLLVLAVAVYVEAKVAREPIIPLRLFNDRTMILATIASALIGVAMFGSTVYLSQYFQLSRGMTPTEAGLMSIAMVGGLLVSSILIGRIITRTGLWKRYLVGGAILVVVGFSCLSTIDHTTNLAVVGLYMAVLGLGMGATMQNLILAVQNNVRTADLGAASATVAFFRSLGGAMGVSALGAVLSHQVRDSLTEGLHRMGVHPTGGGDAIPDLAKLPAPIRSLYEASFGDATGHLFMVSVPFAVAALLCILFIREVPLRTTLDVEDTDAPAERAPRA